MMIDALLIFLAILLSVDAFAIVSIIVIERKDFDKIVSWITIVLILPFIGALGYFIIGQRILLYRLYRGKRKNEEESETFFEGLTGMPGLDSLRGLSTTEKNSVEFFIDGNGLFSSLKNDIESARCSIYIEYYIFIEDELGKVFIDSLCKKAKEGLNVMLIGDGFGFRKLSDECIDRIRGSGIRFTYINRPSLHSLNPRTNNCDHRKMIIIDHNITYCGGLNITEDYIGSGHLGYWRDSAVRVEGDISEHAERRFMMTWAYATGDVIQEMEGCSKGTGDEKVTLVYGGPDLRPNPILEQYLQMILSAKKELLIETPYLMNAELIRNIKETADSGVEVKIIIPGRPDHWFTFWNNYRSAKKLIPSDVKIFLYENGFMHSKIVAVDRELSSVGSANFDDRMFHSEKVTGEIFRIFNEDLEQCRPFDPKEYEGLLTMLKVFICNVVKPLS